MTGLRYRIKVLFERDLFIAGVLGFIAFVLYINSLGNGFVGDDHSIIQHNPVLREENPLNIFNKIDTPSDTMLLPYYRPLTYLTFWIELRVHSLNPSLMHFVNVILHSINAFLVFYLGFYVLKERYVAFIASLLFAIHPLNSEAVNFLSGGRNTLLACFFSISAFLIYKKGIERNSISLYFLSSLFFLAGVFSKESGLMVLPFIIFLALTNIKNGPKIKGIMVAGLVFYCLSVVAYLFMRWQTLSALGIQSGIIPGTGENRLKEIYIIPDLGSRLIDNIYIIPKYLLTLIFPYAMSPRYVIPDNLNALVLPLFIGWLLIVGFLVFIFTKIKRRVVLFGLSWAFLFWLPVSGLFVFSSVTMAERFMYIPAIGIWIILAELFSQLVSRYPNIKKTALILGILICLILSFITFNRNGDWRSDLTLFTRLVKQYPDNQYGHLNLAAAYIERGDLALAEKELEGALSIDSMLQDAYTPLGFVKLEKGDFNAAVYYYTRALEFFPLNRDARINRAIAYEKLGMLKEALADYKFYLNIQTYNNIPGSYEYAAAKVRELEGYVR